VKTYDRHNKPNIAAILMDTGQTITHGAEATGIRIRFFGILWFVFLILGYCYVYGSTEMQQPRDEGNPLGLAVLVGSFFWLGWLVVLVIYLVVRAQLTGVRSSVEDAIRPDNAAPGQTGMRRRYSSLKYTNSWAVGCK